MYLQVEIYSHIEIPHSHFNKNLNNDITQLESELLSSSSPYKDNIRIHSVLRTRSSLRIFAVLCGLCNPQQGEREMLRAKGSRYGMKGPSDISSLEGDGIEHLRHVTQRSDKSGRELHSPSGKIKRRRSLSLFLPPPFFSF